MLYSLEDCGEKPDERESVAEKTETDTYCLQTS